MFPGCRLRVRSLEQITATLGSPHTLSPGCWCSLENCSTPDGGPLSLVMHKSYEICVIVAHALPRRYVTEGMFRASHRAECDPAGSPREGAHLPGAPFHSFAAAAAQPLRSGEAARLRFQLLPTAYRFAKVLVHACS